MRVKKFDIDYEVLDSDIDSMEAESGFDSEETFSGEDLYDSDDESREKNSNNLVIELGSSDDDDDEANEDLSLRIFEKSRMLHPEKVDQNGIRLDHSQNGGSVRSVGRIDISSSSSPQVSAESANVTILGMENGDDCKNKDTNPKENSVLAVVVNKNNEEMPQTIDELNESALMSDNVVLRKLLRGPRYFDPASSGLGSCYNCGEEGHLAAKCTSAKPKKACYKCGSLGHTVKTCTEGHDCYICGKGGHRAKDCQDKNKSGSRTLKICLKCGDSGHDMFHCRNELSADDLKDIRCYICKSFGHLCCAKFGDELPRDVSCYQCGQLGHTGLACIQSWGEAPGAGSCSSCYNCGEGGHFARECFKASTRTVAEIPVASSPSYCYNCGVEGHFARECINASCTKSGRKTGDTGSCYKCGEPGHFARECMKVKKRIPEFSTPSGKSSSKCNDFMGVRSAPHDVGRPSKKKKKKKRVGEDKAFSDSRKPKRRGGWISEDPPYENLNTWRSPKRFDFSQETESYKKSSKQRFATPNSQNSGTSGWHGYSGVRYGNSSSAGSRRYDRR